MLKDIRAALTGEHQHRMVCTSFRPPYIRLECSSCRSVWRGTRDDLKDEMSLWDAQGRSTLVQLD